MQGPCYLIVLSTVFFPQEYHTHQLLQYKEKPIIPRICSLLLNQLHNCLKVCKIIMGQFILTFQSSFGNVSFSVSENYVSRVVFPHLMIQKDAIWEEFSQKHWYNWDQHSKPSLLYLQLISLETFIFYIFSPVTTKGSCRNLKRNASLLHKKSIFII